MRLDPKHFNAFIIICAVLTMLVIIYSTIRYSQKQVLGFQENIAGVQLDTLSFRSFMEPDSLFMNDFKGQPVIIHFWSTWSEKSHEVNRFLEEFASDHPELTVIAAAVRDADELILGYIQKENFNFNFVDGTGLFQIVYVPGVPAQILVDRKGQLFTTQIGDDTESLQQKLTELLGNE